MTAPPASESKRSVTILGSTGSVGVNTLRVIEEHPSLFGVVGLAAGSNASLLKEQANAFSARGIYLNDLDLGRSWAPGTPKGVKVFSKKEGLRAFSSAMDADILVVATSGVTALYSVLDALDRGRRVALANKEILVMAGALVMAKLKENPTACLIPVDSEHNAIFQCLEGNPRENVEKIILTGSGGPLRQLPGHRFNGVSKEEVVNHPKWKMGKKISVDSATMMNKGLEIIEASWLFGMPIEKIEVLIHPEAMVHSMIELKDGAILAQLGVTDMRLPIQHALSYPRRLFSPSLARVDWTQLSQLTFQPPDRKKFPCLDLAWQAARQSGSAPCVLSAADEVAVGAYLEDKIDFLDIPCTIEKVLSRHRCIDNPSLSEVLSSYDWAIEEARKLCQAR